MRAAADLAKSMSNVWLLVVVHRHRSRAVQCLLWRVVSDIEIWISILALDPARLCYGRKTPVNSGVAGRFTVGFKMVRASAGHT